MTISILVYIFSRLSFSCVCVSQLCLTLGNPIDCSPLGSSVHGILQARMLEWVAISFSKSIKKSIIKYFSVGKYVNYDTPMQENTT